ncbi:hypothetical protein [Sphingomonas sp.]|uniref:hypothetical protein n=1 Tax=Sphingomonas sp. TaxID=28214 RepID=UPI001ECD3003|nr:hypothetical protein [Sphingomonas sp.]MBX3595657.1 hypothetical protein [Sphingomonas sp.]
MSDPLIHLWTAREADAGAIPPEQLRARDAALRRRAWRRDLIEYAAGALVVAIFAWYILLIPETSMRIASAVIIAGTLIVMRNLWKRRAVEDPAALADDAIACYRSRLAQQRDMLASVARWYLAPLVPGLVLFVIATVVASARVMAIGPALATGAITLAFAGALFVGILLLNRRAARTLDAEIAALDAMRDPPSR